MAEQKKHLRLGTKGLAGRVLPQSPIGPATTRSALQRVVGKPRRDRPSPEADPMQKTARAGRAAQAALGMMGRKPADFDDEALAAWLKALSEAELKKLSKLVWAARQGTPAGTPPGTPPGDKQPFDRVARQLADQGIQFAINANTVVINIGEAATARPPFQPRPRRHDAQGDWGRSWGRVKDFINGH